MRLLFVILLALVICACSKSPAPSELPAQASHIKQNETKQRLSRYGNPAEYHVNGKTYQVMPVTSDFKQQGIASWYGPNFHKKRTSSGEVYDMYQMTAAHKTLPIPSVVKVKNLENNKEITVLVNDRGPFHGDRIIDLSYAAAKFLGMLKKGTANVTITRISDAKKPLISHYYLQVGAFSHLANAQSFAKKITNIVKQAQIHIENKSHQYLVQVGPISSLKASKAMQQKFINHGYNQTFSLLKLV